MSHNELSDGWVKCDGGLHSPQKYPKAFAIYGTEHGGDGVSTFAVPDWRGDAIRINDDERGVDPERVLGSEQGDAIRNITGSLPGTCHVGGQGTGALRSTWKSSLGNIGDGSDYTMEFDASLVVPTADENRMRNRSCCMYVYIGRPGIDA